MSATRLERRGVRPLPGRARVHGFAIITAIFLIVVLASLGTFMLSFSTAQHTSAMQDLQGAKAYQAARTGIEWGAYQIRQVSGAGSFATGCQTGNPSQTLPPLVGDLTGFQVVVTCTYGHPEDEGSGIFWAYQLEAVAHTTASAKGMPQYVERVIDIVIEK